ncbi:dethiobiotin synthase [Lichenicoccus sp.]|uniref:dethiobiotin synthase n=1 Tax=Lichenicoccus sp. TaxID=2781899 RepID=UPI003D0F8704
MSRAQAVGARFGAAADRYDHHAAVQRTVAARLADRILAAGLPAAPRILEFGAGTGLLTDALHSRLAGSGHAPDWTVTDVSPAMVARSRATRAGHAATRFLSMDAERPSVRGGYDLICGSLAMQWFSDRPATLRRLAGLLAPGGLLAVSTLCSGSFAAWHAALRAEGLQPAAPDLPGAAVLQAEWPGGGVGAWSCETVLQAHQSGIGFLRGLRAVGADLSRADVRPAEPLALRRALRRFEREHAATAEYRIGTGLFRRSVGSGVFVTGTGTGIGKTLVAACLARAWNAAYWKPLQTGIDTEAGDSETVGRLARLPPEQVLPPACVLRAPLSPEAAAALEGVAIDFDGIRLPPHGDRPVVVEGAGGLMVPIADGAMMIDLMARLALPVVLVASSMLGTINHTLLSLEALRARGIPVAGVVLNGPPSDGNRDAIRRYGRVRVLAELPMFDRVDAAAIDQAAGWMPSLRRLEEGEGAALDPPGTRL